MKKERVMPMALALFKADKLYEDLDIMGFMRELAETIDDRQDLEPIRAVIEEMCLLAEREAFLEILRANGIEDGLNEDEADV